MIDDIETPATTGTAMPDWQRNLLTSLCGIVAAGALGFMTGATVAAFEDGVTPARLMLPAAGLLVALAAGWIGWRLFRSTSREPVAPRIRTSRKIIIWGGVLGLVFGIMLSMLTDLTGGGSFLDNGPVNPLVAGIAIIIWLVLGLTLNHLWLASIDEHERQANYSGALAALYAYLMIEPSWWFGWRGGFLPQQQPMVTFLIVLAVYSAVWFWRRNR